MKMKMLTSMVDIAFRTLSYGLFNMAYAALGAEYLVLRFTAYIISLTLLYIVYTMSNYFIVCRSRSVVSELKVGGVIEHFSKFE
jgi:hypothetical protein